LLRAWELRYGLLRPSRSPGGFRLYSPADEERVKRMRAFQTQGLSAAEAARLALGSSASADTPARDGEMALDREPLAQALERFDEPAAQEAFDRALSAVSIESLLRDLVIPYLHDLGERWKAGTASVAQEHFASNFLRGRLLGLARGWGQGGGPLAILACAPRPWLANRVPWARHSAPHPRRHGRDARAAARRRQRHDRPAARARPRRARDTCGLDAPRARRRRSDERAGRVGGGGPPGRGPGHRGRPSRAEHSREPLLTE
jgi:DNA-binding transcriptional MerR regulator